MARRNGSATAPSAASAWSGPAAGTAKSTATSCRRTPPATRDQNRGQARAAGHLAGPHPAGERLCAARKRPARARSFKDTARVLLATRLSVAWSAVGHATACYETAVQYAKQRMQFGRPLAASQIVQERLARMLSELSTMQLMAVQMTRLDQEGTLTAEQASLAK